MEYRVDDLEGDIFFFCIICNSESAAKVTSASTDYELLPFRTNTTLLNEPIYRGRVVSRKEMMLEDEKFPDERFELDPDLYDIQGEDDKNDTQESDSDELDDTGGNYPLL